MANTDLEKQKFVNKYVQVRISNKRKESDDRYTNLENELRKKLIFGAIMIMVDQFHNSLWKQTTCLICDKYGC